MISVRLVYEKISKERVWSDYILRAHPLSHLETYLPWMYILIMLTLLPLS